MANWDLRNVVRSLMECGEDDRFHFRNGFRLKDHFFAVTSNICSLIVHLHLNRSQCTLPDVPKTAGQSRQLFWAANQVSTSLKLSLTSKGAS